MGTRVWAVLGLLAALGAVIGCGLWAGELLARRTASPLLRALARALPAALVLVPLGNSLFDGARASSLPGAGHAWLWLPLVGVAIIAATIRGAAWLQRRHGPVIVAGVLVGLALLVDVLNRLVLRSEYPDLHTAAIAGAAVLGGLGLRMMLLATRPLGVRWPVGGSAWWMRPAIAGLVGLTIITFMGGLDDKASRRAVQEQALHARLLTRVARAVIDLDRDGHSTVLGGAECHDLDDDVHPGARDVPGNGRDEDCDGADSQVVVRDAAVGEQERQRAGARQLWRQQPEVESALAASQRMNVLLVAVDGLRADPFVDNPANRAAYPGFFRFFDGARRFERAFSPAAGTDLAMAGLFTGKADPMSGAETTLAESLAQMGYHGHAVVPGEVLRAGSPTLFGRGFARQEVVVTDPQQRDVGAGTSSARVTRSGLSFLRERSARARTGADPFFLWLHYFDVHEHHQIPANDPQVMASRSAGDVPGTRAERYRAMVGVVDRALSELWRGLDETGLTDRTLVVLMSDHGESLLEDPRLPENHGRVLYQPLTHVPLAMRMPGAQPAKLWQPVSLLDVSQTVLDVVGGSPLPAADGESLLPLLIDTPQPLAMPPRPLPLNESEQFGVVLWPHKLLVRPQDNVTELYDLSRDFGERRDLAEEQPDKVRELLSAYQALPAPELDRTRRGRARWEENMRASARVARRRAVATNTSGAAGPPRQATFAP